jgi:hypothetical protein
VISSSGICCEFRLAVAECCRIVNEGERAGGVRDFGLTARSRSIYVRSARSGDPEADRSVGEPELGRLVKQIG